MRAVWLTGFGPPGALVPGDAPDPGPGAGQVLIDVEFAGVTFIETQLRAGRPPYPGAGWTLPVIPGNGVGGVITATGPGADPALAGLRVVSSTGGSGGYAQRAAVAAAMPVAVPGGLAMADAVALLADGRTAIALIRAAAPVAGERVLVEAAAGGVGSLLVQLARSAGATVIAAAGGDRKLRLARGLGAEVTVGYRSPGWADEVRRAVGGIDVVFDGVGGRVGRDAFGLLAPGGRMLVFGMASGTFTSITDGEAAARQVTLIQGVPVAPELARDLSRAALAEAAAGRLRPLIGQRFPLAGAAEAHAAIESRAAAGKTLLIA
jgi:NADPH2:quinone reductase